MYEEIIKILSTLKGDNIICNRAIHQLEMYQSSDIEIERVIFQLESDRVSSISTEMSDLILDIWYGRLSPEVVSKFVVVKDNPHKHYMTRSQAYKLIQALLLDIESLGIEYEILGSYRRQSYFVGDIDIMLMVESLSEFNTKLHSTPGVTIVAEGESKDKIIIGNNRLEVDIRACKENSKGAMLVHFTGPRDFNIGLRAEYKNKGMKLNEYGVTFYREFITKWYPEKIRSILRTKNEFFIPIKDEATCFKLIGRVYVDPWDR